MSEIDDDALIAALWRVVAAHGWAGLTMGRLAAESGRRPDELRARFASRLDLLLLHLKVIDRAVLSGTVAGQGGLARDRVFDVLMRRLDAMQIHRAGILKLMQEMRRDPGLGLLLASHIRASMTWMLDAAEIEAPGCRRQAFALGLAGIWLMTLRAWAADESEDLGPTMAALDRALDRAEQLGRGLRLFPRAEAEATGAEA